MADSLPLDVVVKLAHARRERLGAKGERRPRKSTRRGGSNGFAFSGDDRAEEVSMSIAACNEFARANRTCSHSLKVRAPSGLPCSICLMPVVERVAGFVYKPGPKPVGRGGKVARDDDDMGLGWPNRKQPDEVDE